MRDVRCEGCGDRFRCRADDVQPCWCASVVVSDEARVALSVKAGDCVCPACLAEAAAASFGAATPSDVDA